jgi:hypothetical protein
MLTQQGKSDEMETKGSHPSPGEGVKESFLREVALPLGLEGKVALTMSYRPQTEDPKPSGGLM